MRKFGPGVIGKDEAIADREQRRTSPAAARFIHGEDAGLKQHISFGSCKQLVELVLWKRALQEEQVDREGENIAGGQTFRAVHGDVTPIQIGEIIQAEAVFYDSLNVPDCLELRNGFPKAAHAGAVEGEAGTLGHALKCTSKCY